MSGRIERLRATLEEPLLVLDGLNVRYLTGFLSSNAALLVEPDRVRLFSDFRYAAAGRRVRGVEFVQTKRAVVKDIAGLLESRIGFESHIATYATWETLAAGGAELVPRTGLVEALRAVKDDSEQQRLRAAAAVTNDAFARFATEHLIGETEKNLAWRLEQLLRESGADAMAFDPIVAAGPTADSPHTDPTNRRVQRGDTIVVDAGAKVDGYCSDCTRTFVAGELKGRLAEAYDVVLRAQQAGLDAIRPAVRGADADSAARSVIEEAGFGPAFGHGLGHGVGLFIHEEPRLSEESTDTLAAGNAVTVEPGIYLEGIGGIRIEDFVLVGEDGPEILTSFPKELTIVG